MFETVSQMVAIFPFRESSERREKVCFRKAVQCVYVECQVRGKSFNPSLPRVIDLKWNGNKLSSIITR